MVSWEEITAPAPANLSPALAKLREQERLEITPDNKTILRDRGMCVRKTELLTKSCYVCNTQGSLDNQLIPRWISKETMVCVCAGCYERSVGWVKVDNAVKITDFNIGKDFLSLSGSLQNTAWKAQTKAVLNTPKR